MRHRLAVLALAVTALTASTLPAPAAAAVFRVTAGGVDNDLRAGLNTLVWEHGADLVRYVDDAARGHVTIFPSIDVVSSAQVGPNLFFATEHDLYVTDGATVDILATLFPTYYGPVIAGLQELNGGLLFGGFTADEGREPWYSNGTGAAIVQDIYLGPDYGDFYPSDRAVLNGVAYFNGDDGAEGEELWGTNGTSLGTTLVLDLRDPGQSEPHEFVTCGSYVYFSADDGVNGRELWRTDGSGGGTLVVDVRTGVDGSSPNQLTCVGTRLFFLSENPATQQDELWRYDPAADPAASLLKADWGCDPTGFYCGPRIHTFRAVGGLLLFAAGDGTHGIELWKSDGTPAGTVMVKDICPGPDYWYFPGTLCSSDPYDMEEKDGKLYFKASHPDFGNEIWVSDGTAANTWPITDVLPGSTSSWPDQLTSAGRFLFFRVTGDGSYNVWGFDPANTPPYRDLVIDGSFESSPTSAKWARLSLSPTQDIRVCNQRSLERCSLKIAGSTTAAKGLRQTILRSGALGDSGETIALSGWSKAQGASAAGGVYGLELLISYKDGTTARKLVIFSRGTHTWQYRGAQLKAAKPWSKVTVTARYERLLGTAWFDDLRLTVR